MTSDRTNSLRSIRTGFSLVELLVAIAIIGLLVTLTLTAGLSLIRNRKATVTEGLLSSLDRALEEYITATGGIPFFDVEDYEKTPGPFVFSMDTGPNMISGGDLAFPTLRGEQYPRLPDASVFIDQAQGAGQVDDVIASIPERYLVVTRGEDEVDQGDQSRTPSVIDAWAEEEWERPWPLAEQQLVYYIHPDNELAEALYGQCQNERPYFMSAGPDMFYGNTFEFDPEARGGGGSDSDEAREKAIDALEDNVYSYPGIKGTHDTELEIR